VGIAGVIVGVLTLKNIERQSKAAEIAAKAGAETAEAGKAAVEATVAGTAILISTQRAFVSFLGEARIVTRLDESGGILGYEFQLSFENSGSTPALNLLIQFNGHWRDDDLPADYSYPDFGEPGNPMMIGPRVKQFGLGSFVPREVLSEMRAGRKRIYLYGWAEYRDIFFPHTPIRRTEYCFQLKHFEIVNSADIMIQLSAHPNHNNAN
jgi:hypothetical protein